METNNKHKNTTKKTNLQTIKNAIDKSTGLKKDIYGALGISRTKFYLLCKEHPELNELIDNKTEEVLDFAESKLQGLIEEGNITAIIFFLKCKGKKRGYTERTELEVQTQVNEIKTIRLIECVRTEGI